MNDKKKIANRIDLSKLNYKRKVVDDGIEFKPTYLSELFKKPSDSDPVEKQKAREELFRSLKEGKQDPKPPTGSFTK